MDGQEVETYLRAFGDELTKRDFQGPIDILIVGGVHMVMHVHNRPSTEDIDFRFLSDGLDLTKLPLSTQEKAFRAAINVVAKQQGLPRHWLNDDAGPFVAEYVVEPVRTFWQSFGPLCVYFTDNTTILVYKLMGYSPKQRPDIYALAQLLNVSSYLEIKAIVDRLVTLETQQDFEVEDTIRELFR